MGAVVNMRPDLYKGVIAARAVVDVVTTMSDASIPLTTGEYEQWGNPADKPAYDYILSYSPYDNVKPQPTPTCWCSPACTIRSAVFRARQVGSQTARHQNRP